MQVYLDMDDLYDNLENYNDVNVIEELRNENQELKAQVENCTATIEKLQKDFDKLEAEYKKLELNYSSLLKTARAEVERKTQIITNLNLEKDMMVLNAIQNKNVLNVRRNWPKGKANNNQPKANELDSGNKPPANQLKTQSASVGGTETSKTPLEHSTTTGTESANKLNIKNEKSLGRASDTKENVVESIQKARPARAGSIRCRRKSMPATRLEKFSSDEEGEISSPSRNSKANKPSFRGNDAPGTWDRNLSRRDRQDDPYNRVRNYDSDKFRGRDRFEAQRNRLSPERFHRRSKKDFLGEYRSHRLQRDSSGGYRSDKDGEQRSYRDGSGDHRQYRDRSGDFRTRRDGSGDQKPRREDSGDRYQRPEHRKRRFESPSRDKYYQYQQKNHEQFEKDYYEERNNYLDDPTRVRYLSDYDEPSHKRLRTESHHSSEQDSRGHRGQDPELSSQPTIATLQVREDMSCLSPDYLTTELAIVPKEIKLDAEVKLDDPREHSNKYTIRTENGTKVLSTVVGRNIDLKPVKNINIPKVEIPKALVIPPSQYSETVKTLYGDMDVDNPASDISSVESGETMGSIYDIVTDPDFYRHKKHPKTDTQQLQNIEDLPPSYHENNIQTTENLDKETMNIEIINRNLQVSGKEVTEMGNAIENPRNCGTNQSIQTENFAAARTSYRQDKDGVTSDIISTKNEDLHTSEKVIDSTEKVGEQIQADYEPQQEKIVAEVSQNDKVKTQTEKVEPTTKDLNFGKTKYKIPKINRDQSGCRERKHLDEKPTKSRNYDKHDNIIKTIVGDSNEQNHDLVTIVNTGKGMVEGDLELSDENSDNIELVKRDTKVTTLIFEQSMPDLCKPNVGHVIDKKHKNEVSESVKHKSPNDDMKEKNIASKQRTSRESNDSSQSKKKASKQIEDTEIKGKDKYDTLNKESKVNKETKNTITESIMSRDMKNKFSDLFGETSSLITPEDLGLTGAEMRIESSSSNYFPIFEDAQDAIDLGAKVTEHKNLPLSEVSREEPCLDKNVSTKNAEKEVQNEPLNVNEVKSRSKSRKHKDVDNIHSVKSIEAKQTKSKCSRNMENEKQIDKNMEANISKHSTHLGKLLPETKPKSKSRKNTDTEKQAHTHKPATEHQAYADKRMELDESKQKSKSSKNTEFRHLSAIDAIETKSIKITEEEQHRDKKGEADDEQPKYTESKRRKSRRNEEKSQLTIDTTGIPQPAVVTVENITMASQTNAKADVTGKEPDVVKTVIISSGVQPSAQEMPVNNFSPILLEPPVTPNIDNRQTRVEIPLLSHSVHIHALATSTPAKEIALQNVGEDVSGTPDVSNASDHASQNNVNSNNDMEAPDVRIFVKRRKRVVKKTTPSKT